MDSIRIAEKAQKILRQAGTRDMERIAEELGITLLYSDEYRKLLGMYFVRWRCRFISLNNRLDDTWRSIVLAHEIGHDQLHRSIAAKGMQEFELFNIPGRTEYEANAFSSHLLIDSDEVYAELKAGCDVVQAAQKLHVPINLLLIKLNEMNAIGYDTHVSSYGDSQFLKNVQV